MKRLVIFILICLVFGAAMSVAVAWWATLREWEDSDFFYIEQNGWTAGMVENLACTSIFTVHVGDNILDEQFGYSLEQVGFPHGLRMFTKTSPPAWFPLSIEPANESSMINGLGAGWPTTCVIFIQELESESYFPQWDLVTHSGILGTNPFSGEEDEAWITHLPIGVLPLGLFIDTVTLGAMFAIPVMILRLTLCLLAKRRQKSKRCPYCNYDLSRSTSALCSECGADPQNTLPFVTRGTNFFSGATTIILLIALVTFGAAFSSQLPYPKLHFAAYHGDIKTVRSELAEGEDINGAALINDSSSIDPTYTPLMMACAGGETDVIQFLIDSGADLEARSSFEATVLHMAINSGSFECVSLLLDNGADANAQFIKNFDALWYFAYKPDNDPRLLDLLLANGYRFEPKGAAVNLALAEAARRDNDKFIHRMLEIGAVPNYGALRGALMKGRVDLLELFVHHGADLSVISEYGNTILHSVTPKNKPREIIEYLVQHELHIDTAARDGSTGLMSAASLGSAELCQVFLDFGADPNLRDDEGLNALDHAIEYRLGDIKDLVSVLLNAGTEVRLVDKEGKPRFNDLDPELEKLLKEHAAANSKEKQSDD